jgi:hypothetical protein
MQLADGQGKRRLRRFEGTGRRQESCIGTMILIHDFS